MGKILDIRNSVKAKIYERFSKIKERKEQVTKKRLSAKLKYMNDDELEDYIMLQIKKLQKTSKENKKEVKTAVVTAIQSMEEPEKQLEVTAQISDELTKRDKGQIIESIDSTAALLDENGIDIIKGLDKKQKIDIVERIISNQKVKTDKVSISDISDAVDKIHCLVNDANDFTLLKYIGTVQDRISSLKRSEDIPESTKKQIRQTQLKLIKLAAKKVVCNYKNIGYSMRIREFIKASTPKGKNSQEMKDMFLEAVAVEGDKIGLKGAKNIIRDLLEKEEERYRAGEIKKIKRESGKDVAQKIAHFEMENKDDNDARS